MAGARRGRPIVLRKFIAGDVTFQISPDHFTTVTSYEARIRAEGSSTVIATQNLGKPTPSGGSITVNLATILNAQAAGNYTVSIATTNASGTTDSAISNAFTVPLANP